jgi:hypothetical protein
VHQSCIQKVKRKVPRPQAILILVKEEDEDMNYAYTFTLPAPGASDVVERKICVVINDVKECHSIDPTMIEYKMTFGVDQNVKMWLVDIDDAGNVSAPGSVLEFVVIDTVPPPAPESPVISDVVELEPVVVDEPVVDEPVVDEPVVEEPVVVDEPVVEETIIEEASEEVVDAPVEDVESVVEEPVMEDVMVDEPIAGDNMDVPAKEETEE